MRHSNRVGRGVLPPPHAFARLDAALPIEGEVELAMPVEQLWAAFADVRNWPRWNGCFWWSRVAGDDLRAGATLYWCFNPIRPDYPYKLPAVARIAACEPCREVTWEVTQPPGFHALHTYHFAALGPDRCRFGSWEVAEGVVYRALRPFWLAHFRYVRDASLAGARSLLGRAGR